MEGSYNTDTESKIPCKQSCLMHLAFKGLYLFFFGCPQNLVIPSILKTRTAHA